MLSPQTSLLDVKVMKPGGHHRSYETGHQTSSPNEKWLLIHSPNREKSLVYASLGFIFIKFQTEQKKQELKFYFVVCWLFSI